MHYFLLSWHFSSESNNSPASSSVSTSYEIAALPVNVSYCPFFPSLSLLNDEHACVVERFVNYVEERKGEKQGMRCCMVQEREAQRVEYPRSCPKNLTGLPITNQGNAAWLTLAHLYIFDDTFEFVSLFLFSLISS